MTTPVPVVAVAEVFRALASPKRLQILDWLRDPVRISRPSATETSWTTASA